MNRSPYLALKGSISKMTFYGNLSMDSYKLIPRCVCHIFLYDHIGSLLI